MNLINLVKYLFSAHSLCWMNARCDRGVVIEYQVIPRKVSLSCGFVIGKGGDDDIQLYINLPWVFSVYLLFRTPKWRWLPDNPRRTSITISLSAVYGYLWKNDLAWIDDGRSGWFWCCHWDELITGIGMNNQVLHEDRPVQHTCRFKHDLPPFVGYPEGVKNANFTIDVQLWEITYSRWYMRWYVKQYHRMIVNTDVTIMVPGKGENRWDQDDYVYGEVDYGASVKTPEEAIRLYCSDIARCMQR